MDRFINFELISNPLNWVIVALMLYFATFALALLMKQSGGYAENTL